LFRRAVHRLTFNLCSTLIAHNYVCDLDRLRNYVLSCGRGRDVTDFGDSGRRQRSFSDVIEMGVPVLGRHGGGRCRTFGVGSDV